MKHLICLLRDKFHSQTKLSTLKFTNVSDCKTLGERPSASWNVMLYLARRTGVSGLDGSMRLARRSLQAANLLIFLKKKGSAHKILRIINPTDRSTI